jgi:hypothetical protein
VPRRGAPRGRVLEGVAVRGGRTEIRANAQRHGEVDDDLYGEPEVKHDGVRRVGGRLEGVSCRRQLGVHASQVPFHGRDALGKNRSVERQGPRFSDILA